MYKRILVLSFVFMLAFAPVAAVAAEVDEEKGNANQSEEVESTDSDEADAGSEESDGTAAEAVEGNEEVVEDEESDIEADTLEEATEEETDEAEDATTEEETEEVDEEEISTFATEDEDLILGDILGTANGDIEFDITSGNYVLGLQAGLTNVTNGQDIEDKWVGFAIPNGVDVVGDLPSGVVPIFTAGKSGLAVKVPNIQGIGGENVYHDIQLTGEVDDNDPVLDLYLFNVDTEANQYEEIGEISGQRGIDFSVMEADPTIDLSGSITGETKFDSSQDKVYYLLDVTVHAENNTDNDFEDLYVGFELPDDVAVLNTDDVPEGLRTINLGEGKQGVALKLPALEEGSGNQEITYSIPVIGMSDEVIQSETINLYTFGEDGYYNEVGQFPGSISVDFSGMNEPWYFDVKNEVITDYPGVNDNQKGFRFNYTTKNLTLDDVDEVVMEFVVPEGITIEKPQYIGSGVDIDWNGNIATVTLGDLRGGAGYYGYFTAVGTTSKSISELLDTEVTVTLYRDGEEEVITLSAPFVEGAYDENDFDTPPGNEDDDEGEEDDGTTDPGGNGGTNDDNGQGGNGGTNGDGGQGGNGGATGDNNQGGQGKTGGTNNQDGKNKDGTDDEVTVVVEDGDDSVVASGITDDQLPKTATNTFSMMLAGFVLMLVGGASVLIRRKASLNK